MNHEIKYLFYILFIFGIGAVIVQSIFVPFIEINNWRPDLVLVVVLLIGKRFGSIGGSTAGLILGIIQDSLTGMPVGITALPKVIAGYASGKIKTVQIEGTLYFIWFVVLILVHESIAYAFFRYKTDLSYSNLLLSRVFPNTIYTMIMLIILNVFSRRYFSE